MNDARFQALKGRLERYIRGPAEVWAEREHRQPHLGGGELRRAGAADHARRRETFGKPLAQRQAIAFMLAEMATDIEAARQLVLHAGRAWERGHAVLDVHAARCLDAATGDGPGAAGSLRDRLPGAASHGAHLCVPWCWGPSARLA